MSAVANASRLVVALQAGMEIPPDVRSWLLDGLHDYLERGRPLNDALGLTVGPGRAYDQPHVARRLEARDSAIRAIKYWTFPGLSEWQAAGRIVEMTRAHELGDPLDLSLGHPAEILLTQIVGWQLSHKQIYRILRGDRSC